MNEELRRAVIAKLVALQQDEDREQAHVDADKVLCQVLTTLGYEDVVKEYHRIAKWYS